jgi:rubrerythrin
MNLQEAIQTAIINERKVRDYYANGAKSIQDPVGRKSFETLAKEEQGHVDYLEARLAEWTASGRVSRVELKTILPSREVVQKIVSNLKKSGRSRVADHNDVELVKVALEIEKTTSGFYRNLVGTLSAADQPLFQRFLEIEEGHVVIVQAELDSLQGLGYWFDVMEFQLESG